MGIFYFVGGRVMFDVGPKVVKLWKSEPQAQKETVDDKKFVI